MLGEMQAMVLTTKTLLPPIDQPLFFKSTQTNNYEGYYAFLLCFGILLYCIITYLSYIFKTFLLLIFFKAPRITIPHVIHKELKLKPLDISSRTSTMYKNKITTGTYNKMETNLQQILRASIS